MNTTLRILTAHCLLFFSIIVHGQGAGDTVRAVYVDENNHKWFGTNNGLLRFDGSTWSAFYSSRDVPGNINALANESSEDGPAIWIGTSDGITAARYELDGISAATRYHIDNSELESNRIIDIVLDSSNAKFFATPEGLGVFENDQWTWLPKGWGPAESGVPNYEILSIGADNDTIYVGAERRGAGRVINDVDGFSGASYYEQPWTGIAGNTVKSVFTDSNGHQWFGTTEGLSYHTHQDGRKGWDLTLTTSDGLVNNTVNAVFEDASGVFWIATNGGVSKLERESLLFTNYTLDDGLADNHVFDIAEDQDRKLWFATANGVSAFNGNEFINYSTAEHAKDFTNIIAGVGSNISADNSKVRIYPNPAKKHLYIYIENAALTLLRIEIYNMAGKSINRLYDGIPESDEIILKWNLSESSGQRIQQGIYFITISSPGSRITRKVVIF
ncbi:two-component regulator propeller domain-containing protein [Bacteroidota bacterium]